MPLDKLAHVVEKYKIAANYKDALVIPDLTKVVLPKQESELEIIQTKKEEKKEPIVVVEQTNVLPDAFGEMGTSYKVSKAVLLTEHDSDYVVSCVKHIFEKNIVLQFNVTNKVNDSVLDNVGVKLDLVENVREKFQAKAVRIAYEETGQIYVACARNPNALALGAISCKITFFFKTVDTDGEILDDDVDEDEYKLEKLKLLITDYCVENTNGEFKQDWDDLATEEINESFAFPSLSLQDCVDKLITAVALKPLNDKNVTKKGSHLLFFSGKFTSGDTIVIQAKCIEKDAKYGVSISAKSSNQEFAKMFVAAIKK